MSLPSLGALGDAWVRARLHDTDGVPLRVEALSAVWDGAASRLWLTLASEARPLRTWRWVIGRHPHEPALKAAGDAPGRDLPDQLGAIAGVAIARVELAPEALAPQLSRVPPLRPTGARPAALVSDLGALGDRLYAVEHDEGKGRYALGVDRVFASWEAGLLLAELRERDGVADCASRLAWWPDSEIRPLRSGMPVVEPRDLAALLGAELGDRLRASLDARLQPGPADRRRLGALALPSPEGPL